MKSLLEQLNDSIKEQSDAGICYLDFTLAVDIAKYISQLEIDNEELRATRK
jgi:hypothetical protein